MTCQPLRIAPDIAIFIEDGAARFRPPQRDPEVVLRAVLGWQEANVTNPRANFVEEWLQLFELPARLRPTLSDQELARELDAARSIRQTIRVFAKIKMKQGVPEDQALIQAEQEVRYYIKEAEASAKWPKKVG